MIIPLDIRSNRYFGFVKQWKDGKLACLDGWSRFSEISFRGSNRLSINHVVNFPRMKVEPLFRVWPEADLWWISSDPINNIAHTPTRFTKSFRPYRHGSYWLSYPTLLDIEEGILILKYTPSPMGWVSREGMYYVFYNYIKDEEIYRTRRGEQDYIFYDNYVDDTTFISHTIEKINEQSFLKFFVYDWRTGGKTENELTRKMSQLKMYPLKDSISKIKRFFISESSITNTYNKIQWDEEYKDVIITPINPLIPTGKHVTSFLISNTGEWVFSLIGMYSNQYTNRPLYRRAFYHVSDRYPGGISFPIIIDFTHLPYDRGGFVEHPIHGMCYAVEYYKTERNNEQLYLRLYKMSDVLAEINRQILEKANQIIR